MSETTFRLLVLAILCLLVARQAMPDERPTGFEMVAERVLWIAATVATVFLFTVLIVRAAP